MADKLSASSSGDEVAATFPEAARGKTAFITGGNAGLGFETARVLGANGADVVVACRSQAVADDAVARLRALVPAGQFSPWVVDLSDLTTVRESAKAYVATGRPLHLLINNAVVMALPTRQLTKDGNEMQFGVNHLGHFALTNGLLPALLRCAPSRVVNLSSVGAAMFAPRPDGIPFDDLKAERGYDPWGRYGSSKLANILHAEELQRRLGARGVTAVAVHPGGVPGTKLQRYGSIGSYANIISKVLFAPWRWRIVSSERLKSIPEGAATTLVAALSPAVVGGAYYQDCQRETTALHPLVGNAEAAARLWAVSEELTGTHAPPA